ncbi:LysM peptidoglycan-binding domain-containing protein [Phytoactinopolyspora limicola]|uniref:LysM peptidoglycan-binding domain-containing protein n=1 Tax=Phytoactinopolyspora limicola TaxID=2715536 RepID=UPI001A9C45B6|nr:LysM peptidoglycan-binding domain-containing protein [Phytoactinopolyspora limicola]
MSGIDATVVLGLAGKVNQVFADDHAYQSFPLAPIGLKADSLRAMVHDQLSAAGAHAHAQFSLLVNEIPAGPLWQPAGDRLWDVYGDLLTGGVVELLEPRPTPERTAAYEAAFARLYEVGADGVPVPSDIVVAYEQHRDAYRAASIEYNNRKGEALMAADEAARKAWEDDEPDLRAAIDAALAAWHGPGHRAEVEAARQVLAERGTDSPATVWEGFRRLFNPLMPEIFFRSTVENLSYVPTGYLPSDVIDTGWPRITVTAAELRQLAEQAPPELRSRLGSSADAGITRVTFEYSYVTVSRPWFTPALFASRAWRFTDAARMLSDGQTPPTGECTAYVVGLVLARRITVERSGQQATDQAMSLGFLPTKALVQTVDIARPYTVTDLTSRVALRQSFAQVAAATDTTPLLAGARARQIAAKNYPSMRTRAPRPDRPPRAGSESSATVESTTDPNDVFVLALQCRLLPRSPDPDPELLGKEPRRRHTVAKGDTLSKIAAKFYGDAHQWRSIYAANRDVIGPDPDVIRVGQKLTIP